MLERPLAALALAFAGHASGQGFPSPDPVHLDDTRKWGTVLTIAEPEFPREALAKKLTGYVDVEGTVSGFGTLVEPRYLPEREAAGIFVAPLAEVMRLWQFHVPLGPDCLPSNALVSTRVWFEIQDDVPKISVSRRSNFREDSSPEALAYRGAIKRVQPVFPSRAIRPGSRGANIFAAFKVDATGQVGDVKAVAFPRNSVAREFEQETERALARWAFPADASAVGRLHCMSVNFRLTN